MKKFILVLVLVLGLGGAAMAMNAVTGQPNAAACEAAGCP